MSSIILLSLTVTFVFRILYYAIGEPSSKEPNPLAILSRYVAYLSAKRLHKEGVVDYDANFIVYKDAEGERKKEMYVDLWNLTLNRSMKLFSWENVVGICPTCTFFWLSVITILLPAIIMSNHNYLLASFIWSSSNILNKIIIKWT